MVSTTGEKGERLMGKQAHARSNFGAKGWGMIGYCALLMYLGGGINTQGSNLFSSQAAAAHGWEYVEILRYFTYAGWIAILVSLAAGQFIMKRGSRSVCVAALAAGAAGLILLGVADSRPVYIIAVILTVCSLVVYSNQVPNTLMNQWFPRKKAMALGWSTMGFPLVSIFFPRMFLWMMEALGYRSGFFLFGGILLALAAATALCVRDMPEEAGAWPDNDRTIDRAALDAAVAQKASYRSPWSVSRLLKCKTMWLCGISMGLLWLVVVGIAGQWIPRIVSLGYERSFAVNLLTLNGVVGLGASYFWGYIDQRLGTKRACIIYGLYYILELICLLVFTSAAGMYLVAVVAGIGTGGIANLIPSLIGTIWGRWDFPAVNRVLNPLTNFLKGSAALVISFALTRLGGYTGMYLLFIVLCAAATGILLLLDDRMIGSAP